MRVIKHLQSLGKRKFKGAFKTRMIIFDTIVKGLYGSKWEDEHKGKIGVNTIKIQAVYK